MESDLQASRIDSHSTSQLSTWLITFGDLLTLLLCFFLSMIGMGALKMNQNRNVASVTARKDVESAAQLNSEMITLPPGTPFAPYEVDEGRVVAILAEAEFSNDSAELENAARERLKQAVTAEEIAPLKMMVEVCAGAPNKNEAQLWDASIVRALTLRRQLVDVGAVGGSLSLRSVGGDCDLLQEGAAERVAARVVIQDKGSTNG